MIEITYSIPAWSNEYVALNQLVINDFENKHHIHVDLLQLPILSERAELNRIALYHRGPDVSHLGTTWVRDMIAMQSLHPFEDHDLRRLGGRGVFIEGAWQSCHLANDSTVWAIPYFVEAAMINYRKDLLDQAGIDSAGAFGSLDDLNRAAEKLAQCGVDIPVELPAPTAWNLLHALSGWIWSAGYDYCSPDGREVWFARPEVQQIIGRYFNLVRMMSPEGKALFTSQARSSIQTQSGALFIQGKAGVTLSPFTRRQVGPDLGEGVLENWYATPYPLAGNIGGQDLIVWKHAHHIEACVELVGYLTSPSVLKRFLQEQGYLPARAEVYEQLGAAHDPVFEAEVESIRRGRTYPNVPLWGMIEDRLTHALGQLQTQLMENPDQDMDELLRQKLDPLAHRLNLTLAR